MKNKIALTTFCLLFIFSSTASIHGEIANHLFSSKTVSFIGADKDWEILHQMTLVGTEIIYQTSIKYKGKNDRTLVTSNSRYLITNNHGTGTLGGVFLLNKTGVYHSKKRECGGCEFKDREKELFCEIYWNDKINRVILKRVYKPNN